MQHSVQKQGKFRYNNWRPRQLVTHDRAPYVYMNRKTHSGSTKMSVEEVILWPHYDRYLVTEPTHSSAAARTVILRGRLFTITFEDLDFLAEVRKASSGKKKVASPVPSATSRRTAAEEDEEEGGYTHSARRPVPTGAAKPSTPPSSGFLASDGAAGPSSYSSEDDESGSESIDDDVLPRPAALNYMNPLVAVPSLRCSRRPRPHSQSPDEDESKAGHPSGRHTTSSRLRKAAPTEEIDAEELALYYDDNAEQLDVHGTMDIGKPTSNARMWVVRCPTMDSLRTLVHAMQGIDDYRKSKEGFVPPVPQAAIKGSFEEVEEELRRVKK